VRAVMLHGFYCRCGSLCCVHLHTPPDAMPMVLFNFLRWSPGVFVAAQASWDCLYISCVLSGCAHKGKWAQASLSLQPYRGKCGCSLGWMHGSWRPSLGLLFGETGYCRCQKRRDLGHSVMHYDRCGKF
jgi:hypothetical protein